MLFKEQIKYLFFMTILISITICFASRSQSVAIVYVDCNGRIEQLMILNEPSAPVTALAGIAKMLDVFTLKTDGTANDSKKAAGNGTCLLNLDGQFHLQVCNITEKPEKSGSDNHCVLRTHEMPTPVTWKVRLLYALWTASMVVTFFALGGSIYHDLQLEISGLSDEQSASKD